MSAASRRTRLGGGYAEYALALAGNTTLVLALAGSLVPTTLAGHAYWRTPDAAQRRLQKAAFDKNVSIMGGLLIAAAARR